MDIKRATSRQNTNLTLWAIMLGAVLVRLWRIGEYQFNGDEMQFLINAKGDTLIEVWRRGLIELHPPLALFIRHYLLMLSPVMFVQRLFSVATGTYCVWLMYRLGAMLRGSFLGLFCAFCMAFFPVAVSTSMTFRGYCFFMVFELLALCYFMQYQKSAKLKDLAYFTLFMFLASATEFCGFIIAAAFGLCEGWRLLRAKRWHTLFLFCASFLPLAVLGIYFYIHFLAPGTSGPMWNRLAIETDFAPGNFYDRAVRTFMSIYGYFFPVFTMVTAKWLDAHVTVEALILVSAAWFVALYCWGLRSMRTDAPRIYALVLTLWGVATIMSLANYYPFGVNRHTYYLLPLLIIPFGYAIEPYAARFAVLQRVVPLLIIAFAGLLAASECYLVYGGEFTLKNNDFKDAQIYLEDHLTDKDVIISGRIDAYFYLLYAKDEGKTPYDTYADADYFNGAKLLAPWDPPYVPYTKNLFHNMLQARVASASFLTQANVWFVMYGWKNIEMWHLMECAPLKPKIHNFFTRDGVILFSIQARDLTEFLKDSTAWDKCYEGYKPLISGETFGRYDWPAK